MESGKIGSQNNVFLSKLRDIIIENIGNESFGVEELSREMGLSRSHLYRKMKLLKGQSISQFIREIRLAEAMKLLEMDAATVSEIAYRVGFNTPSYFNKCFHDHFGYPPGAVKRVPKVSQTNNESLVPNQKKLFGRLNVRKGALIALATIITIVIIGALRSTSLSDTSNEIRSIAILPLEPFAENDDQAYLAMGMHDALIGELGKVGGLRVISKTSTLPYLGKKDRLLPEIANELGVHVIVEGSMFITGDSLRLQIQLIEVFPKERHIWAQEYYAKTGNVLSLQSKLVKDIAAEVHVNLTPNENKLISREKSIDPETYKHYLRGMYHMNKNTRDGFETGIIHLKKAIESDPANPYAYSGLAIGYATSGHGPTSKNGVMKRAKAAALQALRIDDNMSNAHAALGLMYLYQEWDWKKAKTSFDRALEINPNNEFAHAHLAWLYLLTDEAELALHHAELAVEINPLYPTYQLWLAWAHQILGNSEKAIEEAEKLMVFEPNFTFAHFIIGTCHYDKGNYKDAIEEYNKVKYKNDMVLSSIGGAYANLGDRTKAMEYLEELQAKDKGVSNPLYRAYLLVSLGKKDLAMDLLNEAYEEKIYPLPWVKYANEFKDMKKDPAFIDLHKRMNIPL